MERIVTLEQDGRRFVFTIDHVDGQPFWRVDSDGKSFPSPMGVMGNEEPGFFRALAKSAVEHYGL